MQKKPLVLLRVLDEDLRHLCWFLTSSIMPCVPSWPVIAFTPLICLISKPALSPLYRHLWLPSMDNWNYRGSGNDIDIVGLIFLSYALWEKALCLPKLCSWTLTSTLQGIIQRDCVEDARPVLLYSRVFFKRTHCLFRVLCCRHKLLSWHWQALFVISSRGFLTHWWVMLLNLSYHV